LLALADFWLTLAAITDEIDSGLVEIVLFDRFFAASG
jgi:hypothetical protein